MPQACQHCPANSHAHEAYMLLKLPSGFYSQEVSIPHTDWETDFWDQSGHRPSICKHWEAPCVQPILSSVPDQYTAIARLHRVTTRSTVTVRSCCTCPAAPSIESISAADASVHTQYSAIGTYSGCVVEDLCVSQFMPLICSAAGDVLCLCFVQHDCKYNLFNSIVICVHA